MITKDYTDDRGIKRRVWVLSESDDPSMGMYADVYEDLEIFYEDTSLEFRKRLYERLWAIGLIEPSDFRKPKAKAKYRQTLQFAIANDATDAIRYIQQLEMEINNGSSK